MSDEAAAPATATREIEDSLHRKSSALFQTAVEQIPGGEAIVALRLEQVDDERAARLRRGHDEGLGRQRLQSPLPMALEPHLVVALKGPLRGDDRVDHERFSARCPGGVGTIDADSVQPKERDDRGVFGRDHISRRRRTIQRRCEPVVDRHANRSESSRSTLAARDAGLGERRVAGLLQILLDHVHHAGSRNDLRANGEPSGANRASAPRRAAGCRHARSAT